MSHAEEAEPEVRTIRQTRLSALCHHTDITGALAQAVKLIDELEPDSISSIRLDKHTLVNEELNETCEGWSVIVSNWDEDKQDE